MTAGSVANLLVAALVSAVVALGVEWLAKPRLEARKERLLQRFGAHHEVRRLLDDILFDATKLTVYASTATQDDDARQVADRVVATTQSLEEAFREVMSFTRDEIIAVLARYVGFVNGVMRSDRGVQDKGDLIVTWTPVIIDVLGGRHQGWLYWAGWRGIALVGCASFRRSWLPDHDAHVGARAQINQLIGDSAGAADVRRHPASGTGRNVRRPPTGLEAGLPGAHETEPMRHLDQRRTSAAAPGIRVQPRYGRQGDQ